MTVIVENGTGLATANSYQSVADVSAWLTLYSANGASNAFTAADTALQEPAVINATRFLDVEFVLAFKGVRKLGTQALQYPREGVVTNDGYAIDNDTLPACLLAAHAELSLRFVADSTGHETSRLLPDEASPTGAIKRKRIKADVVEIDTEYVAAGRRKLYSIAVAHLAPIIHAGNRVVLA